MKKLGLLLVLLTTFTLNSTAQKSPETTTSETINGVSVEIVSGAPSVRGRVIWGGLESWGKVWRAGANKNTTVAFDKDVMVGGKKLAAGKYGFFIIPNEKGNWVAIFSKTNDAWGAYSYKKSEDALRVEIAPEFVKENQEVLNYSVTKSSLEFAWEKARLSIPWSAK